MDNRPTDYYIVSHLDTPDDVGHFLESPSIDLQKVGGVKLTTEAANAAKEQWADYNQVCAQFGVPFYVGGGMMDHAFRENRVASLVRDLQHSDIHTLEISNPNELDPKEFVRIAKQLRKDFRRVFVEIGEKSNIEYPFSWWMRHAMNAEEVGADAIVLEGAVSGTVGIYDRHKNPNTGLVSHIKTFFDETTPVIIEAAGSTHQRHWIRQFGPSVTMANIIMHPYMVHELRANRGNI